VPILVAPLAPEVPSVSLAELTDVTWTGGDGSVVQLTDWSSLVTGTMVTPGVSGHLMPTWDVYSDRSPSYDGENVRGVRANARDVIIPLHMWGQDRGECKARFQALVAALNPQLGQGTLTFTEAAGTSRSIGAYYSQGLEGNDDDDKTGRTWMSAVLAFHAPRPFWEGDAQFVQFDVGSSGSWFPVLPLAVRNSQVLGSVQIQNVGDAECFPVWTVTGPCSSITLTNATTGKSLVIAQALTSSDTAVIDFREGAKTALMNGVTNLYSAISITSSAFWSLKPGLNNITITLPGAAGTTTARMDYKPRYLAAW
jgi:hypothetical protein